MKGNAVEPQIPPGPSLTSVFIPSVQNDLIVHIVIDYI